MIHIRPSKQRNIAWLIGLFWLALLSPYLLARDNHQAGSESPIISPDVLGNTYILERDILYNGQAFHNAISDPITNCLYVAYGSSIVVYDAHTGQTLATIPFTFPDKLALTPDRSQLIVSKDVDPYQAGLIAVINTASYQIVAQHVYPYTSGGVNSREVFDMAVGPGNRLYIAPPIWSNYAIAVMDLSTGAIVSSILLGTPTNSISFQLEIAPGSDDLYLGSTYTYPSSPILKKYDISDVQAVEVDSVSVPYETHNLLIAPDDSFILIVSDTGAVRKYQTTDLALTLSWNLPSPYMSVQLNEDGQLLQTDYVEGGNFGPSSIATFSTVTGIRVRYFKDNPGVQNGWVQASLSENRLALFYYDRIRILIPADYGTALPLVLNNVCFVFIVDIFDNFNSGWPSSETTSTIYRYLSGEYNIFVKQANVWAGATAGHVWRNSQRLEVQGRISQNEGVWGIILGLNSDWTDFYSFELWPNEQRWFLWHFTSSQGWALVDMDSSSSISWNRF